MNNDNRILDVSAMNESDLELYYAAELWSPVAGTTQSRQIFVQPKNLQNSVLVDDDKTNVDEANGTAAKKGRFPSFEGLQIVSQKKKFDCSQKLIVELPDEILQEIFAVLPIYDLLFVVNRVCRRFNNVICEPKYLFYKKTYFKYRMDKSNETERFVRELIFLPNQMLVDVEKCFAAIAWSTNFKKPPFGNISREHSLRIRQRLTHFQKYEPANLFLSTNCVNANSLNESTIWNCIAVLILLSDDVDSLTNLLRCLTAQPQIVHQLLLLEFFYCVLLHLAYIYQQNNVACRLNYNLYYALYLFENSGSKFLSNEFLNPSQLNKTFLTFEQQRIVNYDLKSNECIKVAAFAGTGKTTALLEYVKVRPTLQFLIIFYNKAICEDSQKRFPVNALCRTIHSIAYQQMNIGRIYRKKVQPNLLDSDISKAIQSKIEGIRYLAVPFLVRTTLLNFLSSKDEQIERHHAPERSIVFENGEKLYIPFTNIQRDSLVDAAKKIWEKMKNPEDENIPLLHDGYLKMFQLSKPDFKAIFPYVHVIMVDEAQDCNPTTLDIIERQIHPKVIVGDQNQQIYGFRGSVNALEAFTITKTFYLTQSFRFGPEIAYLANCWLHKAKKFTRKTLVGTDKISFVDGRKVDGQLVIICRSNAQVFSECASITEANQSIKICVIGGIENLSLDLLEDLHVLSLSENVRRPNMFKTPQGRHLCSKYKTLVEIEKHAQDSLDGQLHMKVEIVKRYLLRLPDVINRIRQCITANRLFASFVITTVHKSKGMEYPNVRLASDFCDLEEIQESERCLGVRSDGDDEYNMLYVAMTRAQTSLIINRPVCNVLFNLCRDGLQNLKRIADLPEDLKQSTDVKCIVCGQFINLAVNLEQLILYRTSLAISVGNNEVSISRNGLQCKACFLPRYKDCEDEITLYSDDNTPKTSVKVNLLRKISNQFTPFYK